jgi:hypothetical protein
MDTVSVWAFENAPWREQCRFTLTGEIVASGKNGPRDRPAVMLQYGYQNATRPWAA